MRVQGLFLVLFFIILQFAIAAPVAKGVQIKSGDISDRRSAGQFPGSLNVELIIAGDVLAKCRGIRKISILTAVDSTGRNLLEKERERSGSAVFDFDRKNDEETEIKKTMQLLTPVRSATSIKELSGSLEIYAPARDPRAKVVVKGFMEKTGKPLVSDALKKVKIELIVYTKAQADALKKAEEEKQRKEAESAAKSPVEDAADAMASAVSGLFSGLFEIGETDLMFSIKDPNNKLIDLEVLDAAGKPVDTGSRSSSGDKYIVGYHELPANTAQLVLYLETPTSVIKTPFRLTNLVLP